MKVTYLRSAWTGVYGYQGDRGLHNEHGPAVVHTDGTIFWYAEDDIHKLDGPAMVAQNGSLAYFVDGRLVKEIAP